MNIERPPVVSRWRTLLGLVHKAEFAHTRFNATVGIAVIISTRVRLLSIVTHFTPGGSPPMGLLEEGRYAHPNLSC